MAAMAAVGDRSLMSPDNRKQSNDAALHSPQSVFDLVLWDAPETTSDHDPSGHGHAAHSTLGNRKDSGAHKTTNDDDADLKWVLEFERYLRDIEIGSCKAAPTIAGHGHAAHPTLGNRKDPDAHKTANDDDAGLKCVLELERYLMDIETGSCKAAPTIADSTNETKNAEVCAIADTTNETIKVPDNIYAEAHAILAALPTLADAVLLAQDRLREDQKDCVPIRYNHVEDHYSFEGPKKKRLFGRAKRRHGRPPGFKGPTTISPPSAIALKDSTMLSVGAAVQSAMGDTVTGTFLCTFFCCL